MVFGPAFESLNQVVTWISAQVLEFGHPVAPRGLKTLELCPVAFTLTNPRARCVTLPERRWSLPLALGEFCWHAGGSNDLSFVSWYAPAWREFSDDGLTIRGSCYGHRVFAERKLGLSQWDQVKKILKGDPASRRAVLYFDAQGEPSEKDQACASSLQFLIRAGHLDAILNMRSNDVVWGMPYDVFLFTMLQEWMALELDVPVGKYHHVAASMHLYERHYGLCKKVARARDVSTATMPAMEDLVQLRYFLEAERQLREGPAGDVTQVKFSAYWRELFEIIRWHVERRKRGGDASVMPRVSNSLYRTLLETSKPASVASSS